jgi:hypothetical protein
MKVILTGATGMVGEGAGLIEATRGRVLDCLQRT